MITKISVTFGSKPVLDKIIKKYPERKLALFSATNNANGLQLLDYSGKESIFKNPVVFNVKAHSGEDNWNHYIDYIEVKPDAQKRKILDAQISNFMSSLNKPKGLYSMYYMVSSENSDEKIILTCWDNEYNAIQWEKNIKENFVSSDKFAGDYTANYHTSGYEHVSIN